MNHDKKSKVEERVIGIILIAMVIVGGLISFGGSDAKAAALWTQIVDQSISLIMF